MASADGAVLAAACHRPAHRHGVSQPASWPAPAWQMGTLQPRPEAKNTPSIVGQRSIAPSCVGGLDRAFHTCQKKGGWRQGWSLSGVPPVEDMVEVQVPPSGSGSLRLTLCQGLYHDLALRLCRDFGHPQLVFCPNAGEIHLSEPHPTVL